VNDPHAVAAKFSTINTKHRVTSLRQLSFLLYCLVLLFIAFEYHVHDFITNTGWFIKNVPNFLPYERHIKPRPNCRGTVCTSLTCHASDVIQDVTDKYIDLLKTSLLPDCRRLCLGSDFVFTQDSAPSHRAKAMQQFLRQNTSDSIAADDWASHYPDLNPLDYCVWDILQDLCT